MDHALPRANGNHNDFIQIGAGGPWTIDANWFGVRTGGAASIWLDPINGGLIHDAVISNNVVTGHHTGQHVGIFVGGDGTPAELLPRNIAVVNNTVISGLANSLRFGRAYATLPLEQRPLVANNTGERLVSMCDRIRSGHNVFGFGQACAAHRRDRQPAPRRDRPADGGERPPDRSRGSRVRPGASTSSASRAPSGGPDIGAIEFGGRPAAAAALPPKKRAAPRLVAVKATRGLRQVAVRVRTSNATRFTVTVLRAGRIVVKGAHAGSAARGMRLVLKTPRRGRLVVRVRAFGPGGAVVRLVTVGARP